MNPREWITILENDARQVFFVLLHIDKSEARQRAAHRKHSFPIDDAAYERYKNGNVCSSAAFGAQIGSRYSEVTIDNGDLQKTVDRIVAITGRV